MALPASPLMLVLLVDLIYTKMSTCHTGQKLTLTNPTSHWIVTVLEISTTEVTSLA